MPFRLVNEENQQHSFLMTIALQMSRDQIEERIKQILDEEFDVDPATIMPGSRLCADLGIDGIDIIEFILHLEQKFNITLNGKIGIETRTVAEFVNIVEQIYNAG